VVAAAVDFLKVGDQTRALCELVVRFIDAHDVVALHKYEAARPYVDPVEDY
jgi:hypothetical protein